MTGSTVLPVPSRIADGSVRAAIRSIVSAVIRESSGTRTTFARPAAKSAAAKPGPGAPWTRIRARGATAAASRAAAFETAAPNSAIVMETSRTLEVRTPRKGALPKGRHRLVEQLGQGARQDRSRKARSGTLARGLWVRSREPRA